MKFCLDCGKKCHHQALRCRKCQDKRRSQLISGKNNHKYKDGRTLNKVCSDCGKPLSDYRNQRCQSCENKRRFSGKTYEEIMGSKKAKDLKSLRSLNFGGNGVPYDNAEYGSEFDSSLKERVRFRDRYKCQLCGCSQLENERQLDVHHIDYDKYNCDMVNLVSLCKSCHAKTNYNRRHWQRYFSKLLEKVES